MITLRSSASAVFGQSDGFYYNHIHFRFHFKTKLEEYVMEYTEQQLQRSYTTTSISIFYRQVDDTYFGQLNVEKSSKVFNSLPNLPSISNQSNSQSGSSCLFKLGNKLLTKK